MTPLVLSTPIHKESFHGLQLIYEAILSLMVLRQAQDRLTLYPIVTLYIRLGTLKGLKACINIIPKNSTLSFKELAHSRYL